MRHFDPAAVAAALDYRELAEALRDGFRQGGEVPVRSHYGLGPPADGTLLLMPAWQAGGSIGVKIVTVFPRNAELGRPSVYGTYVLLDGATGEGVAVIDGTELTRRRTAAASALASSYLSRPESSRLLMIGTGALAPHLIRAHAAVRPIREVAIWGRDPAKAAALAARVDQSGFAVRAVSDLAAATTEADIVSCATLATQPLLSGTRLSPGTLVDLVGSFRPDMREADDAVLERGAVYVDSRAGALREAGDIVQAIRSGALREADIAGDLFELTRGHCAGRSDSDQITVFKSVGHALEDLVAARCVVGRFAD